MAISASGIYVATIVDALDTTQLAISDDGKSMLATILDKPLRITEYTHGQIAEHAGIPKAYYDRMRQENTTLFKQNVHAWWNSKPTRRMVRTLDGNARAWLSDTYRRIDNDDVFESAMNAFNSIKGVVLASHDVTDQRLYLKVLFPRIEPSRDPKVGDIQAGAVISTGEIGNGALNVKLMTYRLWCLNGATHESVLRQAHLGKKLEATEGGIVYRSETLEADDKALMMKLQDAIASVQGAPFEAEIKRQYELAGAPPMPNPVKAIEMLAKKVGLTPRDLDSHVFYDALIDSIQRKI